jgi:hypothetical protein
MGILKMRHRHFVWFGTLYLASVGVLALAAFSLRGLLHAILTNSAN